MFAMVSDIGSRNTCQSNSSLSVSRIFETHLVNHGRLTMAISVGVTDTEDDAAGIGGDAGLESP